MLWCWRSQIVAQARLTKMQKNVVKICFKKFSDIFIRKIQKYPSKWYISTQIAKISLQKQYFSGNANSTFCMHGHNTDEEDEHFTSEVQSTVWSYHALASLVELQAKSYVQEVRYFFELKRCRKLQNLLALALAGYCKLFYNLHNKFCMHLCMWNSLFWTLPDLVWTHFT